jgi:hypothetical protein
MVTLLILAVMLPLVMHQIMPNKSFELTRISLLLFVQLANRLHYHTKRSKNMSVAQLKQYASKEVIREQPV